MKGPRARLERLAAQRPAAFGALMIVTTSLLFAAMHAGVRGLSGRIHPFEIAFFRNVFGFVVFLPWIARVGRGAFYTRRFSAHLGRGFFHAGSMLSWFLALSLLPLADATALALSGPLFVSLGAIAFLHERVSLLRWCALLVGAVGALLIVRPGFQAVSLGALLVIGSSVSVAASKLIAKSLIRTDSPATVVAYLAFLMAGITLVPALFTWSWPTLEELGWLSVLGTLGSAGHYLVAKAYQVADVSLLEPMTLTRLIFAAAIGYVAFLEVPDVWVIAGGALIVAATSLIAREGATTGGGLRSRADT